MVSAGFSFQSLRVGFEIHAHYTHAQFLRLNSGTVSHPETEFPVLAVQENHLGAFQYLIPPDILILLGTAQ